MQNRLIKCAFFDRDGTLIFEPQDTFQIDSIEKLKILNDVIISLQEIQRAGYKLILVTNQDGLGTDSFPTNDFIGPQNLMLKIFKDNGINFEKIFICPHFARDQCNCRKPRLGLVNGFLKNNLVDRKKSFVCGDRESDELFAKTIGVKFMRMETNGSLSKALEEYLKQNTL